MPESTTLRTQLTDLYGRLTSLQRLLVFGLAIATIATVVLLAANAGTPSYQTVFGGLQPADAATAVEKIKTAGIPYRLAGDGSVIQVPSERVADVRLMLAAEGLPQGGSPGFELFDKTNFGLTDFAQRVNYRRALEGELARTIGHLESVEQARVHIVIPEPSLYTQEKRPPTASVALKLKPNRRPTTAQIKGITHLVASSVEGLQPEHLTIVDANGSLLNERNEPGLDGLRGTSSQLEIQRQVESDMERSLQTMLDRVLGPNKAAVKVSANLNFDRVEANAETFSPNGATPQVRSERKLTDAQQAQGTTPGGVPGTDANVPGFQAAQGNTQSNRQTSDTTTNYELSKTVEKTVKAVGGVKRLSVAVVLDQQAPVAANQAESIQQLVTTAAGIDTTRGDQVIVSALPFDRTTAESNLAALTEAERQEQLMNYIKLGALVAAPLLVLLVLFIAVRSGRRPPPPHSTAALALAGRPDTAGAPAAAIFPGAQRLPTGKSDSPALDEVSLLAKRDPQMVAQLVRTWIQEDEKGR